MGAKTSKTAEEPFILPVQWTIKNANTSKYLVAMDPFFGGKYCYLGLRDNNHVIIGSMFVIQQVDLACRICSYGIYYKMYICCDALGQFYLADEKHALASADSLLRIDEGAIQSATHGFVLTSDIFSNSKTPEDHQWVFTPY